MYTLKTGIHIILRALILFFYVYTSQYTPRCRAQVPPAGLRTPLPRLHNINKGMHFFLALFFKIFFIFIFFRHIIYVRRWNGGVKTAARCGVFGIPPICAAFSPPAASPNLRRSLAFLRDEVSAVQVLYQPLGLFFLLFFSSSVYLFFYF